MWKFHMVHHSDLKVDATTGTRIHPGDYLFRELFAVATIVAVGIPMASYSFYRFLTIFFTYATHSNIDMPRWLDRSIAWVLVTPNMHKFHHHFELPWTDTNFGNIFSFWDRIFGTFVYDDVKRIRYGLNFLDERMDENVLYQLKLPFNRRIGRD
jgi:sterol desaturase/sphingolipid hydroxylase (fatty acid hydroxylase superfamily)